MHEKTFYVLVAITVQSNTSITENIIDEIGEEMRYNFIYNENEIVIVDTEIKEVLHTYPTL